MSLVFRGFLKIFMRNENFNLTSSTESLTEILNILIFNISLFILSVKPNIKDHRHSK